MNKILILMTNQEMLELIRKDRPNQKILEVVKVCEPEQFKVKGVEYDVHVVMEVDLLEKGKRYNLVLPYPTKPYIDFQNYLVKLATEKK